MKFFNLKSLSVVSVLGILLAATVAISDDSNNENTAPLTHVESDHVKTVKGADSETAKQQETVEEKPMMSVTVVKPQQHEWPVYIQGYGNVTAWQEAVVGSELSGYRLAEIFVDIGDIVKKGQVLAQIDVERLSVELEQKRASIAEAKAALEEANANAKRIAKLAEGGSLSSQKINEYLTSEKSAQARLMSAEASLKLEEIRLRNARILAPDDGVISSRSAMLGMIVSPGTELFRLYRKNKMEWKAEIAANDLLKVAQGQLAEVKLDNGLELTGKVRVVSPTVNSQSRKAMVYIDLPVNKLIHSGSFATGRIVVNSSAAKVLPSRSVVMKDGYAFVYIVNGKGIVSERKVNIGRRFSDKIEILDGITSMDSVVEKGAGFLGDGDKVKVVDANALAVSSAKSMTPSSEKL